METPGSTAGEPPALSFTLYGPFVRLQRRLGLLSDSDLAVGRRALLFVGIAWIPAVVLAALQGFALNDHHERAILLDFSTYAFAIAIAAFVLMEQASDKRMLWLIGEFTARGTGAALNRLEPGCPFFHHALRRVASAASMTPRPGLPTAQTGARVR